MMGGCREKATGIEPGGGSSVTNREKEVTRYQFLVIQIRRYGPTRTVTGPGLVFGVQLG